MTDLSRIPERNELERQLASWMSTVAVEPSTDWLDAAIAVARDHRQARSVPRLPRIPIGHGRPSTIMLARLAAAVLVIVAGVVVVEHRGRAPEPVQIPTPTTAIPSTPTTATPSTSTSMPVVGGSQALVLPTFPDGKVIASLSAVSDSEWFALSDFGPVGGHQSYPKLWHTNDAGVTWVDTLISSDIAGGAHWVHFADPLNGWLGGQCCLFGTHDGGVTWKPIDGVQPMGDERAAGAIASAGGRVYRFADVSVVGHLGNSQVGVMSSPVDRDEFVWSGTEMLNGTWGLTPWSSQLVIRGDSGWAIAYGTTSPSPSTSGTLGAPPGAVRRINGEWTGWDPPCAVSLEGEQQLTTIQVPRLVLGASPSGATVTVVCKQATGGGPLRTFVSGDGGTTFVEAAPLPAGVTMTERSWLLVPDDNTILLGVALDTGELVVEGSHDGGRSWTVETSIANAKEFATATVTPTGRIVVVAGTEGRSRNDQGTWVPTGNTRKG